MKHAFTATDRTCLIVGDEMLAAECGRIATEQGLRVALVATGDPRVAEWAADTLGVDVVPSDGDIARELDDRGLHVDVLVSAANQRVLPDALLDRAAVSVNFHDGPLPELPGVNVTCWAVIEGRKMHGVTWHRMTSDVDGGEIVAERSFPVEERSTAHMLNTRCYEEAAASFVDVARQLATGELSSVRQRDSDHAIRFRHRRPVTVFDASTRAAELDRAVRGHFVGQRTRNTFGSVRLVIDSEIYLVQEAHVVADVAPEGGVAINAAHIRSTSDDSITVDTVDGAVRITRLLTGTGEPVALATVIQSHDLRPGRSLAPAPSLVDALLEADPYLSRGEADWWSVLSEPTSVAADIDLTAQGWSSATIDAMLGTEGPFTAAVVGSCAWLKMTTGAEDVTVAVADRDAAALLDRIGPVGRPGTVTVPAVGSVSTQEAVALVSAGLDAAASRGPLLVDAVARHPNLVGLESTSGLTIVESDTGTDRPRWLPQQARACVVVDTGSGRAALHVRGTDELSAIRLASQLAAGFDHVVSDAAGRLTGFDMRSGDDRLLLDAMNDTAGAVDRLETVVAAFERAHVEHPDDPSVSCGANTVSYATLYRRVVATQRDLVEAGVSVGDRVGIALDRSIEMVVAVLAVLRMGAAYVPLDPDYPAERLRHIATDAGLRVVVGDAASTTLHSFVPEGVPIVAVSLQDPGHDPHTVPEQSGPRVDPGDAAYVIYTSGSTGVPKGVVIEHAQLTNFLAAMDEVIAVETPGVWLSVTSLSFDISVLELLWTLARGFHVVVAPAQGSRSADTVPEVTPAAAATPADMSLFYFAAGDGARETGYDFVLESARFADANGFEAVWLPERHFHEFGGAYPNPSVLAAAVAAVTERVHLRAGSVVLPLHSPIRVAEEWSVVDRISGGRVGVSFAAGWQPNDFVLNPSAHEGAAAGLPEAIEVVERLWRGEAITMPGPGGVDVEVQTLPRPVQNELPIWLTSAGSVGTFERAGKGGRNLLTHLLGQTIDELGGKIELYRQARARAGHEGDGRVTLMLHAYLGENRERALRDAREPLKRYLRSSIGLIAGLASSFPTFANVGSDDDSSFDSLSDDELEQLLDMAADRYLETSGLFGAVDDAVEMIERVRAVGVDEVACLVDFGVGAQEATASLRLLAEARDRVAQRLPEADSTVQPASAPADEETIAELAARHGVTHMQCTPSFAAMMTVDEAHRSLFASLDHLMVGGEALPVRLAEELRQTLTGRLTNMYGPTETTIWSLVHEIESVGAQVPVGQPILNTTVHVMGDELVPLPIGSIGQLFIGGEGLARGYHDRPDLTRERFAVHPDFGRIYATGDLVRVVESGGKAIVEFLGRIDHQIKLRGHRIELGEIESVIERLADVERSVVVACGDQQPDAEKILVAFVVLANPDAADHVRSSAARSLPAIMLPRIVAVDDLPITPNGKVDRSALARRALPDVGGTGVPLSPPIGEVEREIGELWAELLGHPVGRDQNFFDVGGHSLLAVRLLRRLEAAHPGAVSLTDVFRHPTIDSFATHLRTRSDADANPSGQDATDRGARRRAMRRGNVDG